MAPTAWKCDIGVNEQGAANGSANASASSSNPQPVRIAARLLGREHRRKVRHVQIGPQGGLQCRRQCAERGNENADA